MNVIIPIAGTNLPTGETRYIKSLQEIERKTILQCSLESLSTLDNAHFIFVVKREDVNKYHIDNIVKLLRPEASIIIAEGETMGAACTCMLAVDGVDLDSPLLIVGSDQLLTVPAKQIIDYFEQKNYDAGVVVFDDVHPRWSYVRIDENGNVIEAAEKRPISKNATAGFYYYKKASDFFEAAKKMILKNASVNGSYYICPVFNEMILNQKVIGTYKIEKEQYYNFNHNAGIEAYKEYLKKKEDK